MADGDYSDKAMRLITELRAELAAEKRRSAHHQGALAVVEEQLARACRRATELQEQVYALRGEVGDQADAIDELTVQREIGRTEGRTL